MGVQAVRNLVIIFKPHLISPRHPGTALRETFLCWSLMSFFCSERC